jgi:LSD1 subclass zinc finger protein
VVPVSRQAFQASVIDSVNTAHAQAPADSTTMCIQCPACRGPVYVPRDSDRERVVCSSCQALHTTKRTIDGVDLIEAAAP